MAGPEAQERDGHSTKSGDGREGRLRLRESGEDGTCFLAKLAAQVSSQGSDRAFRDGVGRGWGEVIIVFLHLSKREV